MNIEFRHCVTASDLHAGIRVIKRYRRETNQQVGCKEAYFFRDVQQGDTSVEDVCRVFKVYSSKTGKIICINWTNPSK